MTTIFASTGFSSVICRTGLYSRSLIIVIAPIVLLQTIMAGIILDRHWDNVTKVLGRSLAREIGLVTDLYDRSDKSEAAIKEIEFVANKRLDLAWKSPVAMCCRHPLTARSIPWLTTR